MSKETRSDTSQTQLFSDSLYTVSIPLFSTPASRTVPPPHTTHAIDKHARTLALRASSAHRDTGSVRAEVTVAEVAKPGHYVLALVEDLRVRVKR